jgi:hypothetical protein
MVRSLTPSAAADEECARCRIQSYRVRVCVLQAFEYIHKDKQV